MNKEQIVSQIKETEEKLAALRRELKKPEKVIDFKVGDMYNCPANVPLIVMETWGERYFIAGNDCCNKEYLGAYYDIKNPITREKMIDYLNDRVESGWKYIGNISESFDKIVKEMMANNH